MLDELVQKISDSNKKGDRQSIMGNIGQTGHSSNYQSLQSRVSQIDWMGEVNHIQRDITRNNNILMDSHIGQLTKDSHLGQPTQHTPLNRHNHQDAAIHHPKDTTQPTHKYSSRDKQTSKRENNKSPTTQNKRRETSKANPKGVRRQQATP